jgi:D-3-phosphoglycerate dehydrogenase
VAPITPLTVLCAGDRFITAETLAAAARYALGADFRDVVTVLHDSDWPDVPFRSVDGVREAAGEVGELVNLVSGADVLLTHLAPVTAAVLQAGTALRLVGSVRGGPVNIDVEAATRAGVPVAYLPGRNLGAVAEFVVAAMITAPRGLMTAAHALRGGRWDAGAFRFERTGTELRASTVGLVGLGAVGTRVAELVGAFGATVLAHDPYAYPARVPAGVRLVGLDELYTECDVVSVHARLTEETRGMFNAAVFAAMKPGVCFVNTARGELVVEAALAEALASGRVGSAALDVWNPEPPAADSPLLTDPRVMATPHLAGASRQVALESAMKVARAAASFLRDGTLEHCANPEVLTHPGALGVARATTRQR